MQIISIEINFASNKIKRYKDSENLVLWQQTTKETKKQKTTAMATIYIYEAMDAESYEALKNYVCDIESTSVLLNKAGNTIKVYDNGTDAVSEVGKFIDDNALNFHITCDDITKKTQRIAELEAQLAKARKDADMWCGINRNTHRDLEAARDKLKALATMVQLTIASIK